MVRSIWLVFDKHVDHDIVLSAIKRRFDVENYNQKETDEPDAELRRNSVCKGYTLADKKVIEKIIRDVIGDAYDERLECDCSFCTKIKNRGNLIRHFFGFTIRDNIFTNATMVGRDVYDCGSFCFVSSDRLDVLKKFLEMIQPVFGAYGLMPELDTSDD